MADGIRYPYRATINARGEQLLRPQLPLTLTYKNNALQVLGLLDSGADVNVLPYRQGLELGAIWDEQRYELSLSGNLANFDARGIILSVEIGGLAPASMAFAWSKSEHVPLLLGQMNFFTTFDVCFFGSEKEFEVRLRT
jgi:hypothetical protein